MKEMYQMFMKMEGEEKGESRTETMMQEEIPT